MPSEDVESSEHEILISDTNPTEFMNAATAIAEKLNHREVQVAHLLLAMAQTLKGVEYLTAHDLVAEVVHRSCWRELGSVYLPPRALHKVENSKDMKDVYEQAARIGQLRGNDQLAEVQIGDILQAITLPPLNGRFVSICKGQAKIPTSEETRESVALIATQLKHAYPL